MARGSRDNITALAVYLPPVAEVEADISTVQTTSAARTLNFPGSTTVPGTDGEGQHSDEIVQAPDESVDSPRTVRKKQLKADQQAMLKRAQERKRLAAEAQAKREGR